MKMHMTVISGNFLLNISDKTVVQNHPFNIRIFPKNIKSLLFMVSYYGFSDILSPFKLIWFIT